jgi:hypothetical protein
VADSHTAATGKVEATPFRGDFAQLAEVMQRAWAGNKEVPLLYTAPFLESAFAYPGTDLRLSPSIYAGDELLAFIAGFPRRFQVNDAERRFILTSFLTAAAGQKGSSYGLTVWRDIHRLARDAGFDGALSLCVEGDGMNRIILSLAKLFGFHMRCIFTVDYLTRFLRPAQESLIAPTDRDIEIFLELASAIPNETSFARLWTRPEAEWQCRLRDGALTVSACHDQRRGILTGYLVQVAGNPPVKALAVEDILWGDLEPGERKDLLQTFVRAGASRGAQVASCPVMNYADLEPFRAAGFRFAKRRVHVFLTTWDGPQTSEFPSVYLDVL